MSMSQREVLFQETIYPSLGVTAALLALDVAMAFALWAALGEVSALAFLLLAIILSSLWWQSAIHRISLDSEFLTVNQARIERRFLGATESLDSENWSRRIGVDFDPRDFHAHKFWIKSGVEIAIVDPKDPHPHWLVGCRRKNDLAAALNESNSSA